jgi:translation elongation factor EF-1beta
MPKKVHITVRLVPEATKVPDENLKNEIEKELRKNIFVIPWAKELESIEIK